MLRELDYNNRQQSNHNLPAGNIAGETAWLRLFDLGHEGVGFAQDRPRFLGVRNVPSEDAQMGHFSWAPTSRAPILAGGAPAKASGTFYAGRRTLGNDPAGRRIRRLAQ